MVTPTFKRKSIAVLGGGQLGRMLFQEAMDFDTEIHFLDPDPGCPCAKLSSHFTCGSLNDTDTILRFAQDCEVVTIEIEYVSVEALEKLQQMGKKVVPPPSLLRIVQDKGLQKLFYETHKIPTAPFTLATNKEEVVATFRLNGKPIVQKSRTGGYDGKGVLIIRDEKDLLQAFDQPSVLEELIDFETEIAVMVCRNAEGEIAVYDPVQMAFNPKHNLVEFLFQPANVPESCKEEAKQIAVHLAQLTGLSGILAIEMFVTKDFKLLVNEIAPRPHNSGHHTMEANHTSQYGQLLRVLLDLPPGNTGISSPAVMVNLLGEPGHSGPACYTGMQEIMHIPGVYVHLYGKKETRPFRKMGHVTVLHPDIKKAVENANFVKEKLKVISGI